MLFYQEKKKVEHGNCKMIDQKLEDLIKIFELVITGVVIYVALIISLYAFV
jgi:hypothetical protein